MRFLMVLFLFFTLASFEASAQVITKHEYKSVINENLGLIANQPITIIVSPEKVKIGENMLDINYKSNRSNHTYYELLFNDTPLSLRIYDNRAILKSLKNGSIHYIYSVAYIRVVKN